MSTHDTKNVNKKGLRYDAGSWVAEILDDVWASYDVLKTVKLSPNQFQEFLLPHEVPRLPRDCFAVEEFQYSQGAEQSQIFLPNWMIQQKQIPWEDLQLQAESLPLPPLLQDQDLPSQQHSLSVPQSSPIAKQNRVSKPPKGHIKGGKKNKSSLSSSNQISHGQPQQPNLRMQEEQNPPQKEVSQHLPLKQAPIQQWTPLQILVKPPLQRRKQVASSGNPKGKKIYSPQQPKSRPKQSRNQQSTYARLQYPEQSFSVCQIQD